MALRKKLLAEFLGTTLLLACVVGSGIMGVNLSQGNDAIALLANAGATAGVLYVLIAVLGPISGAHFNPAVTLVMRLRGELTTRDTVAYIGVQVLAAIAEQEQKNRSMLSLLSQYRMALIADFTRQI